MTTEQKQNIVGLFFILAMLVSGVFMEGCAFKVETLYLGKTPIGLDNRQATQIRATAHPTPTPKSDRTGY